MPAKSSSLVAFVFIAILANASNARSDVLRYRYSGVVTSGTPELAGVAQAVPVGTRFSGTISYDPLNPGLAGRTYNSSGFEVFADPIRNPVPFTVQLDRANAADARVQGDLYLYIEQHIYTPLSGSPSPSTTVGFSTTQGGRNVSIHLWNPERYLVGANLPVGPGSWPWLPPSPLSLADFATARMEFTDSLSGNFDFQGEIQSLTLEGTGGAIPIPEPATWLTMFGLAGFLVRHARRRP